MERKGNTNRFSNRTVIVKYWHGLSYIVIVSSNTGKDYKILFEDNDDEDLNHTEVEKGEGRMTGEIGQRMRLMKPLGDWTIVANESETLWPLYSSEDTDISYRSYRK